MDLNAIAIMKMPMDTPDHGYAIGSGRQLRSDFDIRRRAALQCKQAYDHLQIV